MKKAICFLTGLVFLSGCASTGVNSRTGASLITLQTEAGDATPETEAHKTGEACSENILGIVSLGDSSIEKAKENGQISKVSSIDYRYKNILFFYGQVCTIVKGT